MAQTNKKRVLLISSDNNTVSGAYKCMYSLCEWLNRLGEFEPIVLLPNVGGKESHLGDDVQEELKAAGIRYCIIPSWSWVMPKNYYDGAIKGIVNRAKMLVKKTLNRSAIKRIQKLIERENIDLIHINSSYSYVGAKAAQKAGVPFVWHIREVMTESQGKMISDKNGFALINSANRIIAISDFVRQEHKGLIDEEKTVVILDGLEENEYYVEQHSLCTENRMEFICAGNMNARKGQDTVIKACGILLREGIDSFHVSFLGSGFRENEYKELAERENVGKHVTFYGNVKNVPDYLKESDVLIMSSYAEGFGRTTVEGMMAGCYIIGAANGGTLEILQNGKYGLLFKTDDEKDLAEKMKQVIRADRVELESAAKEAQAYAMQELTAKRNAERTMEVYREVLK